jgi:hypothetical protein
MKLKARMLLSIGVLALGLTSADARCGSLGCNGTGSNPNSHYVRPHVTSTGVVVRGHYQTNPNGTQYDNYGTRGNLNPHNGRIGTRDPQY